MTDSDTTNNNETKTSHLGVSFQLHEEGLKVYDNDEDRDRASWLWGYYVNVLNKDGNALARETGLDRTTLVQILTGARMLVVKSGRADAFAAVDALRKRARKQMPLVRTIVTQRILDCLDRCRDEQNMTYISGPTGRGKTYAAQYWASQNNHGRTHYVRCPSNCSRRALILALAESFGISRSGCIGDKEAVLARNITSRNVLIIDEAGHLLSKTGSRSPIEFLRDLHDMTHCGVCMIFTDVYLPDFRTGRFSAYFEQFVGRLEYPVEIPAEPRKDEVREVVRSFCPDAGADFVSYALTLARGRDGKLRT